MKDESVYLRHILDAIKKIQSYTSGGAKECFKTPWSKTRLFEIWKRARIKDLGYDGWILFSTIENPKSKIQNVIL